MGICERVPYWTVMDYIQKKIKPQDRNTLMDLFYLSAEESDI